MASTNQSPDQINRATLSSVVTDRLRSLIINGSFEPGTQMSEVELASRFGVSRGPIREGLQRLVQEGLLRSEPHRGVFLPHLDRADIADIYIARSAIEGAAVRIIAESPKRDQIVVDLRNLIRQIEDAKAAQRWSRVAELDMRFHSELVTSTGSKRLARMFASLVAESQFVVNMTVRADGRDDPVLEHELIAQSLESGDPRVASDAIARHYTDSQTTIDRQLNDSGERPPRASGRDGSR